MSDIRDVIMIGAGPSALTAAIYTTREDIDTVLYEKATIGGLAAITDVVDNYPGFPDGIEGMKLAAQLEKQAERFGAHIEFGEASRIRREDGVIVSTIDGVDVKSKALLIATGSDYKKTGVPGEAEYYGRGVHYCATCDGAYYRDKKLVVIGGGNSAIQETLFLTRYASHIDVLIRSEVKASDVLVNELQKYIDNGQVTLHLNTTTEEILATDGRVSAVRIREAGAENTIETDGVFVFIGLKPNTGFLEGSDVELDAQGLIKTDEHYTTSVPGIFASGDVRSGATMQIASAVGEGAAAALALREYLDDLNRQ
ncbi:FAD-dependent oxidoreductase [Candidatus Saccharibacteria bacterium]|nr:FAD-dependent oxidoreductase [Candidatus Saccharibacteria bacterium]